MFRNVKVESFTMSHNVNVMSELVSTVYVVWQLLFKGKGEFSPTMYTKKVLLRLIAKVEEGPENMMWNKPERHKLDRQIFDISGRRWGM